MRTTVETPDEHRARLLQLAAERGEKGFSPLVQEAVKRYIEEIDARTDVLNEALSAIGSMNEQEADHLEESVQRLRKAWR